MFDFMMLAKILSLMFLFIFGVCLFFSVQVQWEKDSREQEDREPGEGEADNEPTEEEPEE